MIVDLIKWVTDFQKYAVLLKRNKELGILQSYDPSRKIKQIQLPRKGSYHIGFIIPGMPAHSGGHTSILRLGTNLSRQGHHVSYISYDSTSVFRMTQNARINLKTFEGQILGLKNLEGEYDVAVATTWMSAYYLYRNQHHYLYKAYFVQDFEPAFFAEGDLYWIAANTYKMGLHLISLGHWNKSRIEAIISDHAVDYIDFPFEKSEYEIVYIEKKPKEHIKIAVYLKLDTKRGPHLLLQSLALLQKELVKNKKQCDIFFFGLPKHLKLPLGQNLGKLNHDELKRLYRSCDLGIVASFSNISLVDYEMIACSLPVVEFKDGSASFFFDKDQILMTGSTPVDFVRNVMHYLDNPNQLNQMIKKAQEAIKTKTWERATNQFTSILKI